MSYFYFFRNDGLCKWMTAELTSYAGKYVTKPIAYHDIEEKLRPKVKYEGEKKFYGILEWIQKPGKGANPGFVKESGMNFIQNFTDLPDDAGVYIGGYDIDLKAYQAINERNIPYIEHPCPWIKNLRDQLLNVNPQTHQLVIMIIKGHMVYECYKSAFPEDTIVIIPDNYQDELARNRNEKPVHLLVYAAFRRKDAEQVIAYINEKYPHPDHILSGYRKTICGWVTTQGLIEEIGEAIRREKLDEIWVICSSDKDTSTTTVIRETRENGARPVIIKSEADIPEKILPSLRAGVLVTAIPMATTNQSLKDLIKKKFP